jgi:tetratricopeptide (TPR) repeat protein
MKPIIYLLFLISFAFSSDLDNGIAIYNARAKGAVGTEAKSQNIDQAIRHFERIMKIDAQEEEAAVYLLKCYYYKGTYVLTDEEDRKAEYNKGKALAEKMVAKYPNSAALRYWYLTCLGKWSEVYGILTAAKEGVADLMKEHSEKIIELDSNYENGGGYFMLGAVHYKSPYIPFILSWPDNDDAIVWLEKAVNTGRETPIQKNYLARALYKDGREDEAMKLVLSVIVTPPGSESLVEERFEIVEAKLLLEDFE